MNDAQKLFDLIERIKELIKENSEPNGICRFNVEQIKCLLEVSEVILKDSNESNKNKL
jgi:hypothetical protein